MSPGGYISDLGGCGRLSEMYSVLTEESKLVINLPGVRLDLILQNYSTAALVTASEHHGYFVNEIKFSASLPN